MKEVETRVLDDAERYPGYDRARNLFRVLEEIGLDVSNKRVADLGTGYGSLAIGAVRAGASSVVAIDAHVERINEVSLRAQQAGLPIESVVANLLMPLKDIPRVDIALLIGVVEYAGLWDLTKPVNELQLQVLRNAYDVLLPGGTLVLATKNRAWPAFALRDIHTNLPLVNIMPRRLADSLSRSLRDEPYREHIHTPGRWKRLIKRSGFVEAQVFYPLFNYQFPLTLSAKPARSDYLRARQVAMPEELQSLAVGRHPLLKFRLMAGSASMGFPLSQGLVVVARKSLGGD